VIARVSFALGTHAPRVLISVPRCNVLEEKFAIATAPPPEI